MTCPHCGAEVSVEARACNECGSDGSTGWAEHADHHGLVCAEPIDSAPTPAWRSRAVTALVTLLAFVLAFVVGGIVLLAAGVAVALGLLAWQQVRNLPRMRERDLLEKLALKAHGDEGLPERLVASELKGRPGMTRARAIELALARLERDRR